MNTKSNKIKCPSCGAQIDVNQVLSHQLEDELERKYNRKLVSERAKLKKAVEQGIQEKTEKIEEISKKKADEKYAGRVEALEKEVKEKSDQVKELHESKAENERLKREKDELRSKITSELEQQLSKTLAEKETETEQFKDKLRKKYDRQLASEQAKLQEEKEAVEKKELEFDAHVKKAVKQGIQEKERILKREAKEEQAEEVKALKDELKEKSDKVKELHKSKAEIERLKREKDEMEGEIELKAQKKIAETVNEERAKIKQLAEKNAKRKITEVELKITERDEVIDQLKDDLKKAEQKANQVPAPLKGEAQELAIEKWLKGQFPQDAIVEIKKGQSGADCLQTVRNSLGKNCGTIYYESKRTKIFQKNWIDKFNADIREKKADIGVLVTQTMPKEMERFGLKDRIWICSFDEFKGLCYAFRDFLIRTSRAVVAQKDKKNKMAMLYDYLTSNEFRSYAEAIVQSFVRMKEGLDKEKRATERRWKQQEKQIEIGLGGIAGMVGAIEGIAGNAIQPPPSLELSAGDEEE